MPVNNKDNRQSFKDNQGKQSAAIRKSILRNVEVPVSNRQAEFRAESRGFTKQGNQNKEVQQTTNSRYYHEPRMNKISELCKRLEDVKMYEARTLDSVHDLAKNSQGLANREISAKLNFPTHQPIFKNLPKLDSDDKTPDVARKLIQNSAKKVAANASSRKSLEMKEEVNALISDLVEFEYKASDRKVKEPTIHHPSENDYLGFSKFSSPHLYLKKRGETQRYIDSVKQQVSHDLFKSEEYLVSRKNLVAEREPNNNEPGNRCKCLQDFYSQQPRCS